jgi:hypothetical protein
MKIKKPSPPLVALRWRDAHGTATSSYEPHELPHAALEIVTYGLLLRDDETGVSIACEDCGGNVYRGVTFVPRELVVECRPVRPVRRKRGAGPTA